MRTLKLLTPTRRPLSFVGSFSEQTQEQSSACLKCRYTNNKMSTDSLLQVRVPPGLVAGSTMTIQGPDGRLFAVIVPPGVAAGDLLTVDVRDVTEGGVTVVATTAEQLPVDRTGERGADKASRAALGAAAVGAVVGTLLIGPITGTITLKLRCPIEVDVYVI